MKAGSSETKGNWEVGTEPAGNLPFKEKEGSEPRRSQLPTSVLHWGSSAPQGTLGNVRDIWGCHNMGGKALLASSGQRSGMLLHILQGTGPTRPHNYLPQMSAVPRWRSLVCSDHLHGGDHPQITFQFTLRPAPPQCWPLTSHALSFLPFSFTG